MRSSRKPGQLNDSPDRLLAGQFDDEKANPFLPPATSFGTTGILRAVRQPRGEGLRRTVSLPSLNSTSMPGASFKTSLTGIPETEDEVMAEATVSTTTLVAPTPVSSLRRTISFTSGLNTLESLMNPESTITTDDADEEKELSGTPASAPIHIPGVAPLMRAPSQKPSPRVYTPVTPLSAAKTQLARHAMEKPTRLKRYSTKEDGRVYKSSPLATCGKDQSATENTLTAEQPSREVKLK